MSKAQHPDEENSIDVPAPLVLYQLNSKLHEVVRSVRGMFPAIYY